MEEQESWALTGRVLKEEMLNASMKAEEFNFWKIIVDLYITVVDGGVFWSCTGSKESDV